MSQSRGWAGRILRVDLIKSKVTQESTDKYTPRFIGGRVMATRVYREEIEPVVGACDPENKILIVTGPAAARSCERALRNVKSFG
ncbi:MAG: aldehyde ferredoxin oxidoreductase N-terminal domain-containing protein [Chloroflexota bacterium]